MAGRQGRIFMKIHGISWKSDPKSMEKSRKKSGGPKSAGFWDSARYFLDFLLYLMVVRHADFAVVVAVVRHANAAVVRMVLRHADSALLPLTLPNACAV